MQSWRNVYFLKAGTEAAELWGCVRSLFPGHKLSEKAPKKLSFEEGDELFSWNCPGDEEELVEFIFSRSGCACPVSLRLAFDRRISVVGGGKVQPLFYEELWDDGASAFCRQFFSLIRKLVPKNQMCVKFIDDRAEAKKIFLKTDCLPLIPLDVKDFQKKISDYIENSLDGSLPASVKFFSDGDGQFFFPESWIPRIVDELWFLGVNFVKSCGIQSAMTRENFLQIDSRLRKRDRAARRNERAKESFFEKIDAFIEGERENVSRYLLSRTHVLIESSGSKSVDLFPSDFGLEPRGRLPDDDSSYALFFDKILCSVDLKKAADEKVGSFFSSVLKSDMDEQRLAEDRISFQLRKRGLEIADVDRLASGNEALEKENSALKRKIADLEERISILGASKNELSVLDEHSVRKSELDAAFAKVAALTQKNSELSAELGETRKDKQALESRVEALEGRELASVPDGGCIVLEVPCGKKELFFGEIRDYLYSCLYQKIEDERKSLPENEETEASRKRDVLESILSERAAGSSQSATRLKLERLESILKSAKKPSLDDLAREGFVKIKGTKTHPKMYFYDERYQVTFSLSPSDDKVPMNKMKEIRSRCFLF